MELYRRPIAASCHHAAFEILLVTSLPSTFHYCVPSALQASFGLVKLPEQFTIYISSSNMKLRKPVDYYPATLIYFTVRGAITDRYASLSISKLIRSALCQFLNFVTLSVLD